MKNSLFFITTKFTGVVNIQFKAFQNMFHWINSMQYFIRSLYFVIKKIYINILNKNVTSYIIQIRVFITLIFKKT